MLSGTPTLSGCCNSSTYVNPSHTIALSFGGPLEANIGWAQVLKSDNMAQIPNPIFINCLIWADPLTCLFKPKFLHLQGVMKLPTSQACCGK